MATCALAPFPEDRLVRLVEQSAAGVEDLEVRVPQLRPDFAGDRDPRRACGRAGQRLETDSTRERVLAGAVEHDEVGVRVGPLPPSDITRTAEDLPRGPVGPYPF